MNPLHEKAVMTARAATAGDLTAMTPEQIDEILFPLWAANWQLAEWLHSIRESLARTLFPKAFHDRRMGASVYSLNDSKRHADDLEADLAVVAEAMAPFSAEYDRRGGWSRYILCGNHNGHLHYSGCSTLRISTRMLLVPQASGLKSSEVVGKFGETACTKCFPGAPVAGQPENDEDTCPGTKRPPVEGTTVQRYRSAYGECSECHTRQIVTANYRIRKHKKAES